MNLCYIVGQVRAAKNTIKTREKRIEDMKDPSCNVNETVRRQMIYWDQRDIEGLKRRIHELHQSLREL